VQANRQAQSVFHAHKIKCCIYRHHPYPQDTAQFQPRILEQSCSGRKGIQCVRQGWQCKLSVVSTSKELYTGRSTADIFHSIEHNEINNRSSYCWHEIWPGGLWPPWASPAPMLRRRLSSGTGT